MCTWETDAGSGFPPKSQSVYVTLARPFFDVISHWEEPAGPCGVKEPDHNQTFSQSSSFKTLKGQTYFKEPNIIKTTFKWGKWKTFRALFITLLNSRFVLPQRAQQAAEKRQVWQGLSSHEASVDTSLTSCLPPFYNWSLHEIQDAGSYSGITTVSS